MGGYTNGAWPESMFITYDQGVDEDGPWKHLVTAGTKAKIDHLKRLALARTGRRLEISPGWSCYRPLAPQRTYRQKYGFGAAEVGKSSHGINWVDGHRGTRIVLAIDFHNWGWVYGGDRNAFYADCRTAGLTPGLIHPSRGFNYPDEPWHVIDLTPFAAPPGAGNSSSSVKAEEGGDDMRFLFVDDDGSGKGRKVWVLLNTVTGKIIATYEQKKANGWATVWGNARPVVRQEFLNAVDAILKTR